MINYNVHPPHTLSNEAMESKSEPCPIPGHVTINFQVDNIILECVQERYTKPLYFSLNHCTKVFPVILEAEGIQGWEKAFFSFPCFGISKLTHS